MELEMEVVLEALVALEPLEALVPETPDLLRYLQVAVPKDILYRGIMEVLVSSALIKILKIIVNRLSVRISFQHHAYHWAVL